MFRLYKFSLWIDGKIYNAELRPQYAASARDALRSVRAKKYVLDKRKIKSLKPGPAWQGAAVPCRFYGMEGNLHAEFDSSRKEDDVYQMLGDLWSIGLSRNPAISDAAGDAHLAVSILQTVIERAEEERCRRKAEAKARKGDPQTEER